MKPPQTGGCQCGKIRYEITEAPQLVYTCHCTDCQRLTSSAFSVGLVAAETAFHLSGMEPRPLQRTADSGRVNTRLVPGVRLLRLRHAEGRHGPRACGHARRYLLVCDRQGISGPAANSLGLHSRRAMRFSRCRIRAANDSSRLVDGVNPRDDAQSIIGLDAGKTKMPALIRPGGRVIRSCGCFQWPTLKAFTTGIVWTVG
jgi:hypothetical protein